MKADSEDGPGRGVGVRSDRLSLKGRVMDRETVEQPEPHSARHMSLLRHESTEGVLPRNKLEMRDVSL